MKDCLNANYKKVSIIIIDSGIDISKFELEKYVKMSIGYNINSKGLVIEDNNLTVKHIHGTVIATIIKYLCHNIEIVSMNILNEKLLSDGRILIYALKQAILYNPNVIHLSLGTKHFRYKYVLGKLVNMALQRNIIIVSAADNQNIVSYPAYLKGVVGVKSENIDDFKDYYYKDNFFYGPRSALLVPEINELQDRCFTGNSMAAAFLTGHISNIISSEKVLNISEIMQILKINVKIKNIGEKIL